MHSKLELSARILVMVATSPLLWCVYAISFVFPRTTKLWVFGSYKNIFSENSKYLFLETALHDATTTAIWLSGSRRVVREVRSLGLRAEWRWSPLGIWHALRAGVHIYSAYLSDTNFWVSGGAVRVNLWHGVPLKVIERDIRTGPLANRYHGTFLKRLPYLVLTPFYHVPPDYVLAPSEYLGGILTRALGCARGHQLRAAYPRIDAVSGLDEADDSYGQLLRRATRNAAAVCLRPGDGKRILYAPTWREWDRGFIERIPADWPSLDKALDDIEATLIVKPHANSVLEPNLFDDMKRIRTAGVSDIYPILNCFDVLITDYSSIYFDFLFLDREIIFFPYDRDTYLAEGRSFYGDYDDLTPGIKVSSGAKLTEVLYDLDRLDYAPDRERIRRLVWSAEHRRARIAVAAALHLGGGE